MTLAILKDEVPPVLLVKGLLCRQFHCLPSELEDESAEILKMIKMLEIVDTIQAQDIQAAQRSMSSGRRS